MKKSLMAVGILGGLMLNVVGANADVRVRGHVRSNGSYVEPHFRSNPDGYQANNYSAGGNTNPYTGQRGYRNVERASDMLSRPSTSGDLFGQSRGSTRLF